MKVDHYRNRKNLCHSLLVRLMCILPDQVLEVNQMKEYLVHLGLRFHMSSLNICCDPLEVVVMWNHVKH